MLLIALAAVVIVFAVKGTGGGSSTPTATPSTQASAPVGRPIDGIHCGSEQLAYHIHQHIDLYLNGKHVDLPAYVGFAITGSGNQETVKCLYWIHVHYEQTPNFIHVESPTKRLYTLGQMLDVWRATNATTVPPNSTFLATLLKTKSSKITAFSNRTRWTRGYRSIPLTEHETITLEIGTPIVRPKLWTKWSEVD